MKKYNIILPENKDEVIQIDIAGADARLIMALNRAFEDSGYVVLFTNIDNDQSLSWTEKARYTALLRGLVK